MSKTAYTEGRLRHFILLHYRKRLRLPESGIWHPIGMGIHVPRRGRVSGGSLDLLFLSDHGRFLIAEIKRRENSERGEKPVLQAVRYWKGLRSVRNFKVFTNQLRYKWEEKKKTFRWVRMGNGNRKVSSRFNEAMKQLLGPGWEGLLKNAHGRFHKDQPLILVIQNGELHEKTVEAIRKANQSKCRVWGLEVSFPEDQSRPWRLRS